MTSVLLPGFLFLLLGLVIPATLLAGRRPVRTWGRWAKELVGIFRERDEEPVRVVSQEVTLAELMVRDSTPAYMGTDAFSGLVDAVDRVLDQAESASTHRWTPTRLRRQAGAASAN
ncbi:Uncharacterised protein [Actinomyces bovis]|uniref:Uncharacterized protein n=1 Tax=Actinomyces bovis TaxID=1658 RepID=A0ABY1VLW9_9ACTO|nr:hypothetical protein [Actinomyces bovis]SPT52671.1 Uncharacterised protein [Actinomyces bovis]VEG54586.1 Uncharacterised protein [Actinomyces israelii]